MRRPAEHGVLRAVFDDLAQVHHRHRIGDMTHDLKIMGNEEICDAQLFLQIHEEVQHLGLDRHVERGYRLVGDDQPGMQHQRPRHRNALSLSPGEHVRIAAVVLGLESDPRHHRARGVTTGSRAKLRADRQRLLEQRADFLARVERGIRILEHHLYQRAQPLQRPRRGRHYVHAGDAQFARGGFLDHRHGPC